MVMTGRHELAPTRRGWEAVFFCDLCGGAVRVKLRGRAARRVALKLGWALARSRLHRCGNCGRWHCSDCHDGPSALCKDCGRVVRNGFDGMDFWSDHVKQPLTALYFSLQKLELAMEERDAAELVEEAMGQHQEVTRRINELLSAVREEREEQKMKEETTP